MGLLYKNSNVVFCFFRFLKFCSEKGGSTGIQNDILEDINELEFTDLFKNLTVNEPPAGKHGQSGQETHSFLASSTF